MEVFPRQKDVLLGKGTSINNHHGNHLFRQMVELQQTTFRSARRDKKRAIAISIHEQIMTSGGRFLMEDPTCGRKGLKDKKKKHSNSNNSGESGCTNDAVTDIHILDIVWIQVDENKALSKVMHRLRDNKGATKSMKNETTDTKPPTKGSAGTSKIPDDHKSCPEPKKGQSSESTRLGGVNFASSQVPSINLASSQVPTTNIFGAHIPGITQVPAVNNGSAQIPPSLANQAQLQNSFPLATDLNSFVQVSAVNNVRPQIPPSLAHQAQLQNSFPLSTDLNSFVQAQLQANILQRRLDANGFAQAQLQASIIPGFSLNQDPRQSSILANIVAGGLFHPRAGVPLQSAGIPALSLATSLNSSPQIPSIPASSLNTSLNPSSQTPSANVASAQMLAAIQSGDQPLTMHSCMGGNLGGVPVNSGVVVNGTSVAATSNPVQPLPFDNITEERSGNLPASNTGIQSAPDTPDNAPGISIAQWIRSADDLSLSMDNYLKEAIKLSTVLVKHLMELMEAGNMNLQFITLENAVLLVEPHSSIQSSISLVIKEVRFQPGTALFGSRYLPSHYGVYPALGIILLEVFSRGCYSQSGMLSPAADTFNVPPTSGDHITGMPPARKRKLSVPTGGTTSVMAKRILLNAGVPVSIRRLVCDLMDTGSEQSPETAFSSIEEVYWDLSQMINDPEHYLIDRICPRKALEDTGLHQNVHCLFGRDEELRTLMEAKERISKHAQGSNNQANCTKGNLSYDEEIDFSCETFFLGGYAGSGKSVIMNSLKRSCIADGWLVLCFKFDEQLAGQKVEVLQGWIKVLADGFNELFGTWAAASNGDSSSLDPDMKMTVERVCRSISTTIDHEGLGQMYELIPNLAKVIPDMASLAQSHCLDQGTPASMERVGAAHERRRNLFSVLFKSICAAGRPVLLTYDDLQWAGSAEGMKQFLINYLSIPCAIEKGSCYHGLLLVGTFRSNEINQDHGIIKTLTEVEQSKKVKVSWLDIGELAQADITKLLSASLYLPFRFTRQLAALVLSKTRGNPFFVVQFLKSIIKNGMLEFSVQSRRWIWDLDVIDMQMISEGVAELLTTRFDQLPDFVLTALKIASCLGCQVNRSIIDLVNSAQGIPFSMQDALKMAMGEGLVEKAGPIYQFTHDIIRQTVYDSIPQSDRGFLHKNIGESMLISTEKNPKIHILAVDQINLYIKDSDTLSSEEKSRFAKINASAAKFSIASSLFEQARSYVNVGLKMLDTNHWQHQYSLSLDLYEMSASVSCLNGDLSDMQHCLNEIFSHAQSFEDSLTASGLLSKLLVASSKFAEAMDKCLSVLSTLGEKFPEDPDRTLVLSELAVIQTTLANISVGQVKLLPNMTDKSKLHTMRFLSMVGSYASARKPLLVPILACRMIRITIEYGFCDDSIIGFVTAGQALYNFTDAEQLGYRIGKVGDALIEESSNRHALRSRLCFELDGTLKYLFEPMQSAMDMVPERYTSSMLAGDVGNALRCRVIHSQLGFMSGSPLKPLLKQVTSCIEQSTKYQHDSMKQMSMPTYHCCMGLSGQTTVESAVNSCDELYQTGLHEKHNTLIYPSFAAMILLRFWMGEHGKVAKLALTHRDFKGPFYVCRIFLEGISCLNIARQTHEDEYTKLGEERVEKMTGWEKICPHNYECMSKLLQAELHHLNGEHKSAEAAYEASIASAQSQKFLHYEALALELHGIFCVENQKEKKGVEQLRLAIAKYEEWGAMLKVTEVQKFMQLHLSKTQSIG